MREEAFGPTTRLCPLCGRGCPRDILQRHHLQTKKVDKHDIEHICRDCHKTIHALFSNKELAKGLNTVEALLENEEFAKALTFLRKQDPTSRTRVKQSRNRRRRR
jgi:hypothetical protein